MNGYRTEPASLDQYLDDVQNETIKSDQAVQRSFCWGNEPMNNLIASAVSQTVYIPNLILSEETKENGIKVMYIVDGGHRTETLRRFRYCGYKTTSTIRDPFVKYSRKQVDKDGEYVRDENGDIVWEIAEFDLRKKTYDDLPPELKRQFNKCPLGMTIYQDCTSEDTSRLVNLYNNHVAMNVSQKSLTYIGKFANYIKKIKDTNRFLIDGTDLTESEKNSELVERFVEVDKEFHGEPWNIKQILANINMIIPVEDRNCGVLGGQSTFGFGDAIRYLKRGLKVARKGWNGKNQYIQLATGISYKTADNKIVNCEHNAIGNMAIAFIGTSGVQMGWLASQSDMLAEDWVFAKQED